MTTVFLDHPWLLSLGLFVLLTATVEAGFRLAVLTSPDIDEERRQQIAASRDGLGILLSLLLGFTLAMALPRFDLRKQLVMDEANAIGTTKSSRRCLAGSTAKPGPHTATCICSGKAGVFAGRSGESQLTAAIERIKALQSSLWQQAEESARKSPTPMTALFVASLNDTIDLSEKRLTALENRIPLTIWLTFMFIALLTCLMSGYGQRRRFWLIAVVSPLMIAIVMGLIADLDSPRSGFLRVDLRSLDRLAQDLAKDAPASPK
jgi:hypothetical protein